MNDENWTGRLLIRKVALFIAVVMLYIMILGGKSTQWVWD